MSEDIKANEVVTPVIPVPQVTPEVDTSINPMGNADKIIDLLQNKEKIEKTEDPEEVSFDDIFITEKNTFAIKILYYKNGDGLVVEGVDDSFLKDKPYKEIGITLKYPNQGDMTRIINNPLKDNKSTEMDIRDFAMLEFSRFICLVRSWTIKKPLNNESIMTLHPSIVKGIIVKIREILGNDGIF